MLPSSLRVKVVYINRYSPLTIGLGLVPRLHHEIGDHVGAVLGVLQAGEGHLGAWDHDLGIGDPSVEVRRIPGEARGLHRVGEGEAGAHARLLAEDMVEVGAGHHRAALAERMARRAERELRRAVVEVGGVVGRGQGGLDRLDLLGGRRGRRRLARSAGFGRLGCRLPATGQRDGDGGGDERQTQAAHAYLLEEKAGKLARSSADARPPSPGSSTPRGIFFIAWQSTYFAGNDRRGGVPTAAGGLAAARPRSRDLLTRRARTLRRARALTHHCPKAFSVLSPSR